MLIIKVQPKRKIGSIYFRKIIAKTFRNYSFNYFFMKDVGKKYTNNRDRMGRLSIIEESWKK